MPLKTNLALGAWAVASIAGAVTISRQDTKIGVLESQLQNASVESHYYSEKLRATMGSSGFDAMIARERMADAAERSADALEDAARRGQRASEDQAQEAARSADAQEEQARAQHGAADAQERTAQEAEDGNFRKRVGLGR